MSPGDYLPRLPVLGSEGINHPIIYTSLGHLCIVAYPDWGIGRSRCATAWSWPSLLCFAGCAGVPRWTGGGREPAGRLPSL